MAAPDAALTVERLGDLPAERVGALPPALPADDRDLALPFDDLDLELGDLAEADRGVDEEKEDRQVASLPEARRGGGIDQPLQPSARRTSGGVSGIVGGCIRGQRRHADL